MPSETGLYYLRSRYYKLTWCRFVNADPVLGNGVQFSHNLFAYCNNAPIHHVDQSGYAMVTCFDENGIEASFMTMAIGGGGCGYHGSVAAAGIVVQNQDVIEKNIHDNNLTGKLLNAGISGGSAAVAIKISAYCGAVGGIPGFEISLLLTVPLAFAGGLIGQVVEDDLQPDNRLGGEWNMDDPMRRVKKRITNGVSPIIPNSMSDKLPDWSTKLLKKTLKKFVEHCLE